MDFFKYPFPVKTLKNTSRFFSISVHFTTTLRFLTSLTIDNQVLDFFQFLKKLNNYQ